MHHLETVWIHSFLVSELTKLCHVFDKSIIEKKMLTYYFVIASHPFYRIDFAKEWG